MSSELKTAEVQSVTGATNDRLWHKADDAIEHAKAKAGKPFRTRCGQSSDSNPSGQREPRRAHELAPMEPCVVCRSLPAHPTTQEETP